MADVFVSYARSTEAKAKVLAASLAEHGYDVWIDHELPNHRAYSEVIEEQIQAARAVLVIWSPDAAASEWVRSEANRGRHERKLVQVAVEKTRLPMPFDQIQCADLSGWAGEGDHPVWRRVLTNLADLIGRNTPSEIGPGASRRSATQERRHLTVLSCALAAGSEVASDLDPEERLGVDRAWRGAAMAAIAEAGGYLAKSDEEMVAWFGYPSAQEDAAERAVHGGLGVVRAVEALDGRSLGLEGKLAARVGIHAGTVVISPGPSGEPEVFGDAPGVARAVQADALPGDVLITGEVHDLVSGLFAVEQALGEGRGLFRVRAATVSRGHGRGFARHGRTPFIGREDETRLLKSRWDRTLDGDGQFILITGEAGIGKSRLVDAFHEQIRSEPHLWVECGGGALFANTALYPVSDMLAQGLGWLGDETDEERLERLSQSLARAGMPEAEPLALVAEMLNLPLKDDLAPPVLPADEKRRRLMAALMNWVLGATRSQPVVLAIEDLHWIDPSTLELIGMLADQIATAPLMLLCTARPDFRSPWAPRGHHSVMVLNRLTARQTRVLVAEVAQGLPDDVVDTVIQRTDGVPLFAEELTRLMSGSGPAKGGIPATLLDSLAARLDQAGAGKQTAQFAAVLGREFSHELLAAISDAPPEELRAGLACLVEAELLYVRGAPPEATYRFKHALFQDVAYETLLKSQRKALHARVAETLSSQFAGLAEAHPEILARHWSAAGNGDKAIAAWAEAARRAAARAAHVEAAEHFNAALEQVRQEAESSARAAAELPLLLGLAVSLAVIRGYTAPEVGCVLAEARSLCDQLGNVAGLYAVLIGLCNFYSVAGDLDAAEDAARQCLRIGEETGNPAQRIQARFLIGYSHYSKGELKLSRENLEGSIELYKNTDTSGLQFFSPTDPLVECLTTLPLVLYALGETELAEQRAKELLDQARAIKRPFELAQAQAFRWVYETFREDHEAALACAEETLAICEANGYLNYRTVAVISKGVSIGRLGQTEAGLALYQSGLKEMTRMGILRALGLFIGEAAVVLHAVGRDDEALAAIDDAIERAGRSFKIVLPRLHLRRADILAALPNPDRAAVRKARDAALSEAKRQGALTFQREAAAALKPA